MQNAHMHPIGILHLVTAYDLHYKQLYSKTVKLNLQLLYISCAFLCSAGTLHTYQSWRHLPHLWRRSAKDWRLQVSESNGSWWKVRYSGAGTSDRWGSPLPPAHAWPFQDHVKTCQDIKTYAQKTRRNAAVLCSLYICCAHFCAYVPVCLGMLVASFGCVFSARGLALKSSLLELPWLGLLGIMELSCSASAFLWFLCLIAIAHASQCSIATEHIWAGSEKP